MRELRRWMNHMDFDSREAAEFLNRNLGTNYPRHRINEWLGIAATGNVREPPMKVLSFIRGYMS